MSTRKRPAEAAPEAAAHAPASNQRVRVRTVAALGTAARFFRAGLGPFGPQAVTVEADAAQQAALRAEPLLIVEDA